MKNCSEALLRLSNQLIHNLYRPLELLLIRLGRLNAACPTTTSAWATITPLQVIATPSDTRIHPVYIFASRWALSRNGLQDLVQLVDEAVTIPDAQRLWARILERGRSFRANGGCHSECVVIQRPGDGEDRIRGWWGEAAGNACPRRSDELDNPIKQKSSTCRSAV